MTSHKGAEQLPVIWLAPPAALLPSNHTVTIQPIPLAVSATLTSLIILVLITLYNRKPKPNVAHESVEPTTLKDSIRVVHPKPTNPPDTARSCKFPSRPPTESGSCCPPLHDKITATDNDSSSVPSLRGAYHGYLKRSLHGPSRQSLAASQSPSGHGYTIPSYYENGGGGAQTVASTISQSMLQTQTLSEQHRVPTTPFQSTRRHFPAVRTPFAEGTLMVHGHACDWAQTTTATAPSYPARRTFSWAMVKERQDGLSHGVPVGLIRESYSEGKRTINLVDT